MKKVTAILAFSFFALSVQAQEAPAKEKTKKETSTTKKEATKTKTECKAEGKKCCSSKNQNKKMPQLRHFFIVYLNLELIILL